MLRPVSIRRYVYFVPLVFAYVQVARLLADYGAVWSSPEVGHWKQHILEWVGPHSLPALSHALDWQVFEYEPRVTRPLSNVFELFDTWFRAMLWRAIPPHPSLSLTWPFSLFAAPYLLYRLLRRLGVAEGIAAVACALYVANPGVLSLEVMLFRPGKVMTLVAVLFCLWEAARQDSASGSRSPRLANVEFALLCVAVYVSFFWDESALILYPALFSLFPRLVLRNKPNAVLYLALPAAYFATVKRLLPALASAAGTPVDGEYSTQKAFLSFVTFSWHGTVAEEVPRMASFFLRQTSLILMDSLGLIDPSLPDFGSYPIVFATIVCAGVALLQPRGNVSPSQLFSGAFLKGPGGLALRALLTLLAALAYEALLMFVKPSPPFGLFYYGVFCVIFLSVALALSWQASSASPALVLVFGMAVVAGTTSLFPRTNLVFKQRHYYPYRPDTIPELFEGRINRFEERGLDGRLLREKSLELWRCREGSVNDVPAELHYALYELGTSRCNLPDGAKEFPASFSVRCSCEPAR
jgi:hypothetical protein